MAMRIIFLALFCVIADANAKENDCRQQVATAIFAGGCFWCMEEAFSPLKGVKDVIAGFTGGRAENPSYKKVSTGNTGHYEAIRISYRSDEISYEELLAVFWRNIDPLNGYGQFCDKGSQYRAAIFYTTEKQKRQAESSKKRVSRKFTRPVRTKILPAKAFFAAENYHQDYYRKNPFTYKSYRFLCGRDSRLEELWGKQE